MTAGSLIKYNKPKLFSELQLIAFFDAGETRKNTTIKEITLKEAFINNLQSMNRFYSVTGKNVQEIEEIKIL